VPIVWLAIALLYFGWQKNFILALLGGVFAAVSLFMNFLCLLLMPFFGWLSYQSFRTSANRRKTLCRVLCSFFGFILFFLIIYRWSGYSIVDNFFVARAANQHAVQSNFESAGKYIIYLFMSLTEFVFYLGIPYVYLFVTSLPQSWKNSLLWFKVGAVIVISFLFIGVFQGETGRLWLFVTPFFALSNLKFLDDDKKRYFGAYLALVMFQIIVTQTLFYNDW